MRFWWFEQKWLGFGCLVVCLVVWKFCFVFFASPLKHKKTVVSGQKGEKHKDDVVFLFGPPIKIPGEREEKHKRT